mmetsp:Transcript_38328/g.151539  ORF Transcript_38328/g.151539 Transcript_38328/m.151539 type:complete len:91 (+) Transcript_38328:887-1159(+)
MRPSRCVHESKAASTVLGRDDEGPQATRRVISGTPSFLSSSPHYILLWMIKSRGFGARRKGISRFQNSTGGASEQLPPEKVKFFTLSGRF